MRPLQYVGSRVLRSRRYRRRIAVSAAVVAGGSVIAGCASDAPQDTWQPAGDNAQKIHDLQWPVFAIAGVVVRDRRGRHRLGGVPLPRPWPADPQADPRQADPGDRDDDRAGDHPDRDRDPHRRRPVRPRPRPTTPSASSTSRVTSGGGRWTTRRRTAAAGSPTPIVTSGQLVIPIETNVLVRGTSRDVIHSWWIPRLNGKRDMVPGRVQTVRLEAERARDLRRPVRRVLRALARQHADGGRRADAGGLRDVEGEPARRVHAARGRDAGRRGRAGVHRPVRALPPGQRARRTPTAIPQSPNPSSTSGPVRPPT